MAVKKILTKIKIDEIGKNEAMIYISYNPKTELFGQVNFKDLGYVIEYKNEKNNNTIYQTKSAAILDILYKLKDERYYNYTPLCKDDLNLKIEYYKKESIKELRRK